MVWESRWKKIKANYSSHGSISVSKAKKPILLHPTIIDQAYRKAPVKNATVMREQNRRKKHHITFWNLYTKKKKVGIVIYHVNKLSKNKFTIKTSKMNWLVIIECRRSLNVWSPPSGQQKNSPSRQKKKKINRRKKFHRFCNGVSVYLRVWQSIIRVLEKKTIHYPQDLYRKNVNVKVFW